LLGLRGGSLEGDDVADLHARRGDDADRQFNRPGPRNRAWFPWAPALVALEPVHPVAGFAM
jgi:hypothetical protein